MAARAASVTVEALGRPDCQLTLSGRQLRLSPRHSEILVILVDHPDGLTGDQLAIELYPDEVSTSTMRAELTRLRSLLGNDLLDSRPYRLRGAIARCRCDWLTVTRAIEAGRPGDALRAYRGPLLPHSDAPGVVERRERIERQLRAAVLALGRGRPDGRLDPLALGRRRPGHVAAAGASWRARARRCTRSPRSSCNASTANSGVVRALAGRVPPGGPSHVATRQ